MLVRVNMNGLVELMAFDRDSNVFRFEGVQPSLMGFLSVL